MNSLWMLVFLGYFALGSAVGAGFSTFCKTRLSRPLTDHEFASTTIVGGLFWPITLIFLIFEGIIWVICGFIDATRGL